jgi:hypothetical protein
VETLLPWQCQIPYPTSVPRGDSHSVDLCIGRRLKARTLRSESAQNVAASRTMKEAVNDPTLGPTLSPRL